jgi:flavin reductase
MIEAVMAGDELRAVMRRFPAGVAVVTVDLAGERVGLTVASLVSLSLDPPLVGVAIRRDAALHELLRAAKTFAVSLLAAGQEALAQHFARGVPPIALWEGIPTRDAEGPPQLEGALGWLTARVTAEHETGDHTFFVGAVETAEPGPAQSPLVFHGQSYLAL